MAKLDSLFASASLVLALSVGCTTSDPTFCDENTPCTDPSTPFCDLAGAVGTKNTCTAPLFDAAPTVATITVELAGQGTGSVSSSDGSLECLQSPCTFDVDPGTTLRFLAAPDDGTSFVTWSGPCEGFGECEFIADASQTLVAVLEPEGSLLWTENPLRSGPIANAVESEVIPAAIAINSKDDIVVVGGLTGTPDFGGGQLVSGDPDEGSREAFAAQFDSSGQHLWSHAYTGTAFSDDVAEAVVVGNNDEVVFSGKFEDAITFTTPEDALDGSTRETYLARLDSNGEFISSGLLEGVSTRVSILPNNEAVVSSTPIRFDWHNRLGVLARSLVPTQQIATANSTTQDSLGITITTGSLLGEVNFTPGSSEGFMQPNGKTSSFIVKVDQDGVHQSSIKREVEAITCIVGSTTLAGGYYIVGTATDTNGLRDDGAPITQEGPFMGFAAFYRNDHTHVWSVDMPSTIHNVATACAIDPRGNLIVGGSFDGDTRLSPTGETHVGLGIFVAKYSGINGALVWETFGAGQATVASVASDSLGRVGVAVQLAANQALTIAGETIPADTAPNLLLMQLAP